MEIFIGCASEQTAFMRDVEVWIEKKGYTPIPWDSPQFFPLGGTTFQTLINFTKSPSVKGALFIFGEDDDVTTRGVTTKQPRGNTVLEYGLFVGALGENKVGICVAGNPTLPTDLQGITYAKIDIGNKAMARSVIETWLKTL